MAEENNKIGVKDLIMLAGIILLGLASFMGLNYVYGKIIAIVGALIIIGAAGGLVYVLCKLKKAETNPERNKIIELIILIIGYGTGAVVSGLFMMHCLTVEMNKKPQIQPSAQESIKEFELINVEYDKYVASVEASLRTKIATAYAEKRSSRTGVSRLWDDLNLGGGTSKDEEDATIATRTELLNDLLKGDAYLDAQDAMDFKGNAEETVNKWDRMEITETLTMIDGEKQKYLDALTELSKKQDVDREKTFS